MHHLIQMCLSFTLNSIQHAHTDCRRVVVYIRQIPRIMLDRVSTVIRLRDGISRVGIAAGARDFVFSKTRRLPLGPHSLILNGYWGLFPEPGRDAEHSLPHRPEVKSELSYIHSLHTFTTCLETTLTFLIPLFLYTYFNPLLTKLNVRLPDVMIFGNTHVYM
jgi:hypothetical protein